MATSDELAEAPDGGKRALASRAAVDFPQLIQKRSVSSSCVPHWPQNTSRLPEASISGITHQFTEHVKRGSRADASGKSVVGQTAAIAESRSVHDNRSALLGPGDRLKPNRSKGPQLVPPLPRIRREKF